MTISLAVRPSFSIWDSLLVVESGNIKRGWHDEVTAWKHLPPYWPFVRGIHWWLVDSPHNGPLMSKSFAVFLLLVWSSWWINSSLTRQNSSNFTDDVFRCIFVNEKYCILIKISLKFVSKGPIDNSLPIWHQTIIWTNVEGIHWCICVALGLTMELLRIRKLMTLRWHNYTGMDQRMWISSIQRQLWWAIVPRLRLPLKR